MRYNFADISSQRELRLALITFHAMPHCSALRGTSPWKVISFKDYLHAISATEVPVGHIGNFLTSHVRKNQEGN